MNCGAWLLRTRKERGLTASMLVDHAGVDSATSRRIEMGKAQVTSGTVVRLCTGAATAQRDQIVKEKGVSPCAESIHHVSQSRFCWWFPAGVTG